MKLSDWAKKHGLNYQTAYRWYKAGKLPASAYQADTGTIIITDDSNANLNKQETEMNLSYRRLPSNQLIKKELDQLHNIFSAYPFNNSLFEHLYTKDSTKIKWFNKSDKYVLGCMIPGYSEEDVKINVKGDILTVSAKVENAGEDNLFFEEGQASFQYSWTLPSDAACTEISASFKNGILYLTVPKISAKQKEEITITINKK